MNNEPFSFEISIVGEFSGQLWVGKFTSKVRLPFRDQLRKDAIKCDLLSTSNAQFANPEQVAQATILADLSVRLTETPAWWKEKGNGLDLEDTNLITEVFRLATKKQIDQDEELKKKAAETQKAMKKE